MGRELQAVGRVAALFLVFVAAARALPVDLQQTMEDQMNLTIRVQGEELSFNLTRNEHADKAPVFLADDSGLVEFDEDTDSDDFAAYTDEENSAAFVITRNKNGEKQYHGIFARNSSQYVIEPRDSSIQSHRRKRDVGIEVESDDMLDSVMFEVGREEFSFEDDAREGATRKPKGEIARDSGYTGGYRSFGVQLLIVVDYKVYRRWREVTRTESDAIRGIRHYFTHVANGIDMRYRSIRDPKFGIYVKLAGIYIAETTGASYWTMLPGIREDDIWTQGYLALNQFEEWVANENIRNQLPPFDQASLFTGNTLFRHREDGSRRPFSGLAAYDSICRFEAPYGTASINHDGGLYASIQTGAHELGHNLGARHDSTTYNGCDSSDQYIMAVSPGSLTEQNFHNVFTFSRCSISDFEEYLLYDLPDEENCLLDRAEHGSPSEINYYLRKYPGSSYDPDHQCKLLFGRRSFYCAGGHADEEICHRMACYDPEEDECSISVEQRAFDGTTCAHRKWCENGECVYDRQAPAAADSCIYGDFKAVIRYVDLTCEDMAKEEPYRCYDEKYSAMCCESCQELKDNSPRDCPYGDRRPSYCKRIEKDDCYNSYASENCCATCAGWKIDVVGCEYGDKSSWCSPKTEKRWQCYNSESRCCESCPKLKLDIFGCEYGDRASWCKDFVKDVSQCGSRSSTSVTCCESCHNLKNNIKSTEDQTSEEEPETGCEDKASWCRDMFPGFCYKQSTRDTCCRTCKKYDTGNSRCKFGDKYTWCEGAKYCKTRKDDCCEACKDY